MKVAASKTRDVAPRDARRAQVGPPERCSSPFPGFASAMAAFGRRSVPAKGRREERGLGESLSSGHLSLAPSHDLASGRAPTAVSADSTASVALPPSDRRAPVDAEALVRDARGAGSEPALPGARPGKAARGAAAVPVVGSDCARPAPARRQERREPSCGAAAPDPFAAPAAPVIAVPADDLVGASTTRAGRDAGAQAPAPAHRVDTATGSGVAARTPGRETVRIDLGEAGHVTLAPNSAGAGGTATLEVPAALATAPLISDLAACGWVARRRDAKSNEPAKAEGRHARRDRQGERRDADGGVGVGYV